MLWLQRSIGTLRLHLTGSDRPLFAGIGPADQVADYLDGVAVVRVRDAPRTGGVTYARQPGGTPAADPRSQDFWAASTTGSTLDLDWTAEEGRWSLVVMNLDGEPGITAEARAAATVPALTAVSVGLLVAGAVLLVGGLALVLGAVVTARPRPPDGPAAVPGPRTWSPSPPTVASGPRRADGR